MPPLNLYFVTYIVTFMANNLQFPIAVHIMAGLGYRGSNETTSAHLASSVNTSASFVRRTVAKLAKAKLVKTTRGINGHCRLARPAREISLLDIYRAVEPPKVFAVHDYKPQRSCIVSCKFKETLEATLAKSQRAMERTLAETSLASFLTEMKKD